MVARGLEPHSGGYWGENTIENSKRALPHFSIISATGWPHKYIYIFPVVLAHLVGLSSFLHQYYQASRSPGSLVIDLPPAFCPRAYSLRPPCACPQHFVEARSSPQRTLAPTTAGNGHRAKGTSTRLGCATLDPPDHSPLPWQVACENRERERAVAAAEIALGITLEIALEIALESRWSRAAGTLRPFATS